MKKNYAALATAMLAAVVPVLVPEVQALVSKAPAVGVGLQVLATTLAYLLPSPVQK